MNKADSTELHDVVCVAGDEPAKGPGGVRAQHAGAAPRVHAGPGVQAPGGAAEVQRRAAEAAARDGEGEPARLQLPGRAGAEEEACTGGQAAAPQSQGGLGLSCSLSLSLHLFLSLFLSLPPTLSLSCNG